MKSGMMMKKTTIYVTFLSLIAGTASAGIPVPLPVAGATGPIGFGIAVVAYAGYRFWNRSR
ncbi:hypothetical protein [Sulfitobacter sp. CW3]|uniref:hypothetical protein n=1 Tax=Sulfitobacter sp. CW3 TaxID=2861965 RepID=UPI001C5D315B|nr:hypothetical protein [Sulfitobacter sp. CW3]MBW4963376.1 hypothetical protein [Sulfitobacter sp. CW3]